MSSVIAAGGLGKEWQKISTSAAVMRATLLREGALQDPVTPLLCFLEFDWPRIQ